MRDGAIYLAVLKSSIALAGLLLVFIGFLLAKADQFHTKLGKKFKRLSLCGLIPFLFAITCSLVSIWAMQGARESGLHILFLFKLLLAVTSIYAIIAIVLSSR